MSEEAKPESQEQPAAPAPAPASNPFAALGGSGTASAFGSGGFGFGTAPSGSAPLFASKPEGDDEGEGDDGATVEEECQAEFKPLVQLEEVETSTGEEDEDCLLDLKSKLYRYDTENNEWKERGIGQVRFLQHKENKKVRLLMRQEKTLKVRANHIVMPGMKLQEHAGSDKAWVWSTVDFSEGEQKIEMFCIRFGSVEKAQEFSKKFEEVMAINEGLITAPASATPDKAAAEADKLADEVESKANVEA